MAEGFTFADEFLLQRPIVGSGQFDADIGHVAAAKQ
jgi:hypothetical protein